MSIELPDVVSEAIDSLGYVRSDARQIISDLVVQLLNGAADPVLEWVKIGNLLSISEKKLLALPPRQIISHEALECLSGTGRAIGRSALTATVHRAAFTLSRAQSIRNAMNSRFVMEMQVVCREDCAVEAKCLPSTLDESCAFQPPGCLREVCPMVFAFKRKDHFLD